MSRRTQPADPAAEGARAVAADDAQRAADAAAPPNQDPNDASNLLDRASRSISSLARPSEAFVLALRAQAFRLAADCDQALALRAHRRRLADEVR